MSTKDRILVAAAKTVMRGWCQHAAARNTQWDRVSVDDPDATSFCATGAVQHCLPHHRQGTYKKVNLVISNLSRGECFSMVYFNDEVASCPEQVAQLLCEAAGL